MRSADRVLILADDPAAARELDVLAIQGGWHCTPATDADGPCFLLERRGI
jgi:hypothetical protein